MGSPRVGSNPTGVDVVYKADGFMQGALGASRKLPTKLPLEILMYISAIPHLPLEGVRLFGAPVLVGLLRGYFGATTFLRETERLHLHQRARDARWPPRAGTRDRRARSRDSPRVRTVEAGAQRPAPSPARSALVERSRRS